MIRVVEEMVSEEGFPFISWEQSVPTGESAHSVQQWMTVKITAVVMMFVFVTVWSASGQFGVAILVAMIVGGMCFSGDKMLRGGVKVWDVHIPGPEPREGAAEEERRLRAIPILGKQFRVLEVRPGEETDELLLCVGYGNDPDAMEWLHWAPLASVQSFELGTAEEWFGSLSDAELRRMGSAPNSWVIVAPTLGDGVLRIAESAGSKAGIVALHGLLTKRFIIDAPEMLARWKEKLEEEKLAMELKASADNQAAEVIDVEERRGGAKAEKPVAGGEASTGEGTDGAPSGAGRLPASLPPAAVEGGAAPRTDRDGRP